MFSFFSARNWQPLHFSYLAVLGASLLGLFFPVAAPVVLGPVLLVGLLGLGLAHGACDQLVLPAVGAVPRNWGSYLLRFVLGYLGLAAVAGLGWWQWPAASVSTFFLLTVWHWGSADAPAQAGQRTLWLAHSVLRGSLLFAVPAHWWPLEVQHSVVGLLRFAGAAPLTSSTFAQLSTWLLPVVGTGHLVLWGCYVKQGQVKRSATDIGEVFLLISLFVVLPPLLALGVYFVFWHSLQHVLRLNRLLGYTAPAKPAPVWATLRRELLFFSRRALPLLLVSLAALASLYAYWPARRTDGDTWLSLALMMAAILTLPHALLVSIVMDAAKWRTPRRATYVSKAAVAAS